MNPSRFSIPAVFPAMEELDGAGEAEGADPGAGARVVAEVHAEDAAKAAMKS